MGGSPVCLSPETSRTALHEAVLSNHRAVVRLLINDGRLDVRLVDKDLKTAQQLAVDGGHEGLAEMLSEAEVSWAQADVQRLLERDAAEDRMWEESPAAEAPSGDPSSPTSPDFAEVFAGFDVTSPKSPCQSPDFADVFSGFESASQRREAEQGEVELQAGTGALAQAVNQATNHRVVQQTATSSSTKASADRQTNNGGDSSQCRGSFDFAGHV